MPFKRKHWGEFEDGFDEQLTFMPKVNFNSLIELALRPNSENEVLGQGNIVKLPVENISLQTVRLVEHNRQMMSTLASAEVAQPPSGTPLINYQVDMKSNVDLVNKQQKNFSWSQIKSKPAGALAVTDCRRALIQAAAITLASKPGVVNVSRVALETLADAVDHFLRTITSTMRTVVDREASSHPSGFADVMGKVFADLGITGLNKWYKDNVMGSYEAAQRGYEESAPVAEVPQLHFPAGLEDLNESFGPGFQMLQTLESEQLPAIHLLETDGENIDLNDAFGEDTSPPVSPTAKKKRK